MTSTSLPDPAFPIRNRLAPYLNLQQTLGEAWVKSQETIHPAKSRYALARWLRIDGYEVRLEMLEQLLTMFKMAPGMGERRNRIRSNPRALVDTVVELHFAAWLRANSIPFEMTKVGADFRVDLWDGAILPVEATTPRRSMWFDDLFDRFMYIKRETGLSARWGFYAEDTPLRGDVDEYAPRGVVVTARLDDFLPDDAAEALFDAIIDETPVGIEPIESNSPNGAARFRLSRPEIGLRAEWWNDGSGYLSGASGARTPLMWGPWAEIRDAALSKVKQLPPGQTSALLVCTNQMDDGDLWNWADWVERHPDQWAPIKWKDDSDRCMEFPDDCRHFPDQIKYIILYKISWSLLEPQCALLVINTESPYPDTPGFEAFRERMFPIPYRRAPSRHAVWASTNRCFDRKWF